MFPGGTSMTMGRYPGMDQLLKKPAETPSEHLGECAREARAQAQLLPSGHLRDALLEKVRQYEAQLWTNALLEGNQWLSASSPASTVVH